MILSRLEFSCFRNLQNHVLEPHSGFNLIIGKNGQGKTNLLEAMVFLGNLRSFRTNRSKELVRFGETQAKVKGAIEHGEMKVELEVELGQSGRRAMVDGKIATSAEGYWGKFATVLFGPEDLQVPRGAPAERRKLLDRAIASSWPAYYEVQRRFQRVLQTRNKVLRERGPRQEELLGVYDVALAEEASRVIASRTRYVRAMGERMERVFARVSRSAVKGGIVYRRRGELEEAGDELPALKEAMLRSLRRSRNADLARQSTTVGPQMDDLEFNLDGRLAGAFGSQGQLRALVISFKLAQMQDAFERQGSYPLLLLDDVSSELDPERSAYLFGYVEQIECQTFVTSTRPEVLPIGDKAKTFQVVNGVFSTLK